MTTTEPDPKAFAFVTTTEPTGISFSAFLGGTEKLMGGTRGGAGQGSEGELEAEGS